jgi:hypothetical protein
MARGGRKYRLLIYQRMINRWWTVPFALAITLGLYVGILWGAQWWYSGEGQPSPLPILSDLDGMILLGAAGFAFLSAIFLLSIRKFAYVQPFDNHLRLVTPFLRLNISYKRIHRTNIAEVASLFPPKSISSWRRDIIAPFASQTAVVIHLTKFPIARFWLSFFLSPFFFADKTPHFILIVDDWLRFNTEFDSARIAGKVPRAAAPKSSKLTPTLLDDLNRKSRK